MNKQSPVEILARLREIETLPPSRELIAERAALLSGVGRPPANLIGVHQPAEWSKWFVELHPGIDEALIFEWFSKFRDQVARQMYDIAHADGNRKGLQDVARLVALNKTLLTLFEQRRLADVLMRDDNNPDAPPIKTSEHIRGQLRAMGVAL